MVVVGLGQSGLSASRWLAGQGARVVVSDIRPESEFPREVLAEIAGAGIAAELGRHEPGTFSRADLVVVSPGVPLGIEPLRTARENDVPVIGEMELACRLLDLPLVGVTGTNGKSTVTELLGAVLKGDGRRVFVGGNLGTPLMDIAGAGEAYDCGVVEVSSFQLDAMESFRPKVSVLLNISPDHLDRYESYEAYVQSKLRIYQHQPPGGTVVLNDDDERLARVEPPPHLRVLRFGMERTGGRAAWIHGKTLEFALEGGLPESLALSGYALPGPHNLLNLLAVVLAAGAMGARKDAMQEVIDSFRPLPHRLEPVGRVQGVSFYDDSKATNVDAAVRAVETFDRPLVLIAGGRHKGGDYGPLVRACGGTVKAAVFIGEAAPLLAEAFEGTLPYEIAGDMEAAVREAFEYAEAGDAVLLAPACSSFDMFTDYAHRGRAFAEAVRRIVDGGAKD